MSIFDTIAAWFKSKPAICGVDIDHDFGSGEDLTSSNFLH